MSEQDIIPNSKLTQIRSRFTGYTDAELIVELDHRLVEAHKAYNGAKDKYRIAVDALERISKTTKGYPNGSREGEIAIEALKVLGFMARSERLRL